MGFEFKSSDAKTLTFGGDYPEIIPQPEVRNEFWVQANNALNTLGLKLNPEDEETGRELYKIASFQIDSLITAIVYSIGQADEIASRDIRNKIFRGFEYDKFIENKIIGLEWADVPNKCMIKNINGTYTLTAFLNEKMLRQALFDPRGGMSLMDINFYYAGDQVIEFRTSVEGKTVIVHSNGADLPLNMNERDWLDRQIVNLDLDGKVLEFFKLKFGTMQIGEELKNTIEYHSPIKNTRRIDIFDTTKTRQEGSISFVQIDDQLRAFLDLTSRIVHNEKQQGEISFRRSAADMENIWQDTQLVFNELLKPQNIFDIRSGVVDLKTTKPVRVSYIGIPSNNKSLVIELNQAKRKMESISYDNQIFKIEETQQLKSDEDNGVTKIRLPNGIILQFSINQMGMIDYVNIGGGKLQA